jgi:protein SCO1/2
LRKIKMELGEEAEHVQVVYVTVDPDRDTPEKVQEYVSLFNPSFIGLSGTLNELEPVWKEYGVFRQIEETDSENGYLVSHTARVYLIDQNGNLRLSYAFGTPTDDILHDVNLVLK